ncbi:MAG: MBL fold metallo-hydrolase [Clostridia bacterium]|nr:MBL fold metallo-hydrolase [Clostridia bacterium]
MMRYCALFSGSSGNSTYVATAQGGLLVDAGVSAKRIELALTERQIDPKSIRAVLVTHEHVDHVQGLKVLCKRYGWPVLASVGTLDALAQDGRVSPEQRLYALTNAKSVTVGDMKITPFATPHDSRESMGFRFDAEDGRSLAVATDMGYMTQEVLDAICGCQTVHIESNHDPVMLRDGAYPYPLKMRILGERGHLSNDACAEVLPTLLEAGATRFALSHLSAHNNTPELALRTASASLACVGASVGRDCLLWVSEPTGTQPIVYF